MSKCRECSAPLKFVRITTTGKAMPVDPVPDEDGNVIARLVGGSLAGRVLHKDDEIPEGWQIFMPHFATCAVLNRNRRGVPPPRTTPTLFDDQPQTTEGAGPRGTEGTA